MERLVVAQGLLGYTPGMAILRIFKDLEYRAMYGFVSGWAEPSARCVQTYCGNLV